ncbi:MAG: response regulator transcription factor [Bacteroidota bacterium]|nr:response regulator transcription factor [Bacteroidota bacterium]
MTTLTAPTRIALLDDHTLFRQGLRFILEPLPYVSEISEAAEFADLQAQCREQLPDLLLLDLQMPKVDGVQAAQLLLEEFPDLKIIVLSMFAADKYITQMMRLGVRSYLPKDSSEDQLVHAIEEVLASGYHFTPRISRALMRGVQPPVRPKSTLLSEPTQFTQREQEVLRLICDGRTAAEIADLLFISKRTVEGHWQKLLEKTGAPNVVGMAVYAARHGLLDG